LDSGLLLFLRLCSYSLLGIGVLLLLFIAFSTLYLHIPKVNLKLKARFFHYRFLALFFGVVVALLFFVSALVTTTVTDSLAEKKLLLGLLTMLCIAYFLLWLLGGLRKPRQEVEKDEGDG